MRKRIICLLFCMVFLLQAAGAVNALAYDSFGFENPSFEDGMHGWYTNGNGFGISDAQSTDGNSSLEFYFNKLQYSRAMQEIKVEKDRHYTITFDMQCRGGQFEAGIDSTSGVLAAKNFNSTSGSWKSCTVEFDSGDNESLVFYIKNTILPTSKAYFDNFEVTEADKNLFVNGGFEDGRNGWDRETFNVSSVDAYEKNNCATSWGAGSFTYQKISVSKNTDYKLSFAYQNGRNGKPNKLRIVIAGNAGLSDSGYPNDGISLIGESAGEGITKEGKLYDLSEEWEEVTEYINSGDNDEIYVSVIHDYTYGYDGYSGPCFDDFRLVPEEHPNLMVNGGFEDGKNGWERGTFNIMRDGGAYEGESYAAHWNAGSFIYQKIKVRKQSEYTFSFAYKSANPEKSNNLRIVIAGNAGLDTNGYPNDKKSLLGNDEDEKLGRTYGISAGWTKVTETIATGDNDEIYISVIHDWTYDYEGYIGQYLDDFSLCYKRSNMVKNGSFENGKNSWETIAYNVDSANSYDGKYAAVLWGADSYTYQKIAVKKNVDYNLSFAYMNVNTDKSNKLRVVVCGESGMNDFGFPKNGISLINEKQNVGKEKPGKLYPLNIEWTKQTETFNSGDNEYIYLVFIHDYTYALNGYSAPVFDDVLLTPAEYEYFDTGFESTGIKRWDSTAAKVVSDEHYSGKKSVKLSSDDNTLMVKLSKTVAVEKEKNYRIGYWYKNEKYGHILSVYDKNFGNVTVMLNDKGKEVENSEPVKRIVPLEKLTDITGEWLYNEEDFYSGDNEKVTIEFSGSSANKMSIFYLDDIKLIMPQPKVTEAKLFGELKEGTKIIPEVSLDNGGDEISQVLYQWQKSDDGTEWYDIEGANSTDYTVSAEDISSKIRLRIIPYGNSNTGGEYYTKVLDSASSGEFEKELLRRINVKMLYTPGWLDSSCEDYIDELLNLAKTADEHDIALSSENISSWDNFVTVLSNISKTDRIVKSEDNEFSVIAYLKAPVKLSEVSRFSVVSGDESLSAVNAEIAPGETVTYSVGGVDTEFAKTLKITVKGGHGDYKLCRKTVYGNVYYSDFSIDTAVSVKNAKALLSDGKVNITAEIENIKNSEPINAAVYAAVYDKSGKLIGAAREEHTLIQNNTAVTFNESIIVPDTDGIFAAIFVWDKDANYPYSIKTELSVDGEVKN